MNEKIIDVILAGGKVKTSTLIFSVFASWMWTTSVIGAVETYSIYGILGPITYAVGACLAFLFYVLLISTVQSKIPDGVTFLDLIENAHGEKIKLFFFMFAFIVPAYVLIEQAVGVASVLNIMFEINFKWTAFLVIVIATIYVAISGMRGLLKLEKLTAFVIIIAFVFIAGYFVNTDTQVNVVNEINAHDDWFNPGVIAASLRYFVMAIVIAFSQLAFDPAYYIKGYMARDDKQFKKAFYIGGILLWGSTSLAASIYLGIASYTQNTDVLMLFNGLGAIIFGVAMLFIGFSTISHYLMGWFGIFTIDLYTDYLRPDADEHKMIVFGRTLMIIGGIFCALIAISLENISLLTIDVFCAIFFAAPTGPLLFAWLGSKHTENRASVIATVAGISFGLAIWIILANNNEFSQFLGVVGSFTVSIICSAIGTIIKSKRTAD